MQARPTWRKSFPVMLVFCAGAAAVLGGCTIGTGSRVSAGGQPVAPVTQSAQTEPAEAAVTAAPQPVEPGLPEPATLNVMRVTFADAGADFDPCITPDGERLVFASTQHRRTSDIYIKRVNSRVVTQLTNDPADDAMPAVSPDGQKIAFASNRTGNWDIFVMPASGGRAVQITSDEADEVHPSWSPDGTKLVFSRYGAASERWEMWVAEGTTQANAHFIGYGLFPQWCPVRGTGEEGADRILFQQARERDGRTYAIWAIDYSDGQARNATQIASSAEAALINPVWSPDAEWIAFAEAPVEGAAAESALPTSASLWLIGVHGEGKVKLTSGVGAAISPAWSKDGRVYFVSNRGGRENIWSLEMAPAIRAARAMEPAQAGSGVAGASAAEEANR